jgi:hypothetical protein
MKSKAGGVNIDNIPEWKRLMLVIPGTERVYVPCCLIEKEEFTAAVIDGYQVSTYKEKPYVDVDWIVKMYIKEGKTEDEIDVFRAAKAKALESYRNDTEHKSCSDGT